MFPTEWKDADFSDKATRKAFADYLEEKGDWRAEEVRRIRVGTWPKGIYPCNTTWYEEHMESLQINSGPFSIDNHPRSWEGVKKIIKSKIEELFENEKNWTEQENL